MSTTMYIILGGAFVTYLTRVGGHMVLSRFDRIHPRVQAGLDAVPAAVLTTLVAPAVVDAGGERVDCHSNRHRRRPARVPSAHGGARYAGADRAAAYDRWLAGSCSMGPVV